MIYRFLAIADIHWGAQDSQLTYDHLQLVLDFIRGMTGRIDFVVICGDYFDYRIQLNSKTALLAVRWFDELITTCRETGVQKVRMIKGTREHDNDQLEVFRPTYEGEDGYFRLFNTTTVEELLPGLRVVFCPDENMNKNDFDRLYYDRFIPNPDIMFFHGNSSSILPSIEYDRIQEHHLPIMIYDHATMSRLVKGPSIAGHWHVGHETGSEYYVGSFDRWKFGEEEPKGFIYGAYNSENSEYYIHRVENPNAIVYQTLMITDDEYRYPADFALLADKIRTELKNDPSMRLRVVYLISHDDTDVRKTFDVFQQQFSSSRQVKIDRRDLVKREEKTLKKKAVEQESREYEYVFNRDIAAIPSVIHRFILDRRGEDISVDTINRYVQKYLEK